MREGTPRRAKTHSGSAPPADPSAVNATGLKDREDLRHLCDNGFLEAEKLKQSLTGAFIWDAEDDPGRVRAFANLEKVIAYLDGKSRDV